MTLTDALVLLALNVGAGLALYSLVLLSLAALRAHRRRQVRRQWEAYLTRSWPLVTPASRTLGPDDRPEETRSQRRAALLGRTHATWRT